MLAGGICGVFPGAGHALTEGNTAAAEEIAASEAEATETLKQIARIYEENAAVAEQASDSIEEPTASPCGCQGAGEDGRSAPRTFPAPGCYVYAWPGCRLGGENPLLTRQHEPVSQGCPPQGGVRRWCLRGWGLAPSPARIF